MGSWGGTFLACIIFLSISCAGICFHGLITLCTFYSSRNWNSKQANKTSAQRFCLYLPVCMNLFSCHFADCTAFFVSLPLPPINFLMVCLIKFTLKTSNVTNDMIFTCEIRVQVLNARLSIRV